MTTLAVDNNSRFNSAWLTGLLMWSIGAIFYFYEFLLNVSPGVMLDDMMQSFAVSATMASTMPSIYLWIYGFMQIPVGVLLDRYGPRRLLAVAALACAIGAYIFSLANGIMLAYIGRALLGFGGAFAIVGCMKIIANWFPPKRFALLLGFVLFIGMFGAVFGETPLALMVNKFTWRGSLQILGLMGIIIALLILFVLRDAPLGKQNQNASIHIADENPLQSIMAIIQSKQTWLASIYGSLMFAPTLAFGGLWGVPFLQQAYGLPKATAAGFISWIFIGWAIGSPLVGWLSDTLGRRKVTMYLGSIGSLIVMTMIIFWLNLPAWLLGTAMFMLGVFSSGFLMAFPLVKEINPNKYNGTALGFINTLNTIGGALLQPFIGFILDHLYGTNAGATLGGTTVYSTAHYQWALVSLPMIILISMLFLPFIQETYCRHIEEV